GKVTVRGSQVAGVAAEGNEVAIAADGRLVGRGIAHRTGPVDADESSGVGGLIEDVDVGGSVGVAGDQVVCEATEGNHLAVGAEHGRVGLDIPSGRMSAVDAGQSRDAPDRTDEHVAGPIRVGNPGDKVRGKALE